MLAAIAGASVQLPPLEIRGNQRRGASQPDVLDWLTTAGQEADAIIASIEYVGYGNLIASRTSDSTTAEVLKRLSVLEHLSRSGKRVYAFNLITRIPNADDCVEEPLYWGEYGTRLYRYSQLLHRQRLGELASGDKEAMTALERQIPQDVRADWLQRRLRNHTVNLAVLDLLARNHLSFLLLTSDDTADWGLSSYEKSWLENWISLLSPELVGRLLVHPGADEIGSALVARLISEVHGKRPVVCPVYAIPGGEKIVAPYEDRAVRHTVEGQIRACGAEVGSSPEDADILLGILPPSERRTEFREEFAAEERNLRQPHYLRLFQMLGGWQRVGRSVALGDVAYPNGADPIAMEILLSPVSPVDVAKLAAYGGWNTAGNTLGTVVAQAVCSLFIGDDPERQRAHAAFLTHRFLEDYGYQVVIRKEARAFCQKTFGRRDPNPIDPHEVSAVCQHIEAGLHRILTQELHPRGIGVDWQIAPQSVALPWRRTFEVDFDLLPR
jgi:hypothetical protein